jgi:hypothetical protein
MITGPTPNTAPSLSGPGPDISTRATDNRRTPGSVGQPPPGLPPQRHKPLGAAMAALRPHRAALPPVQGPAAGAAARPGEPGPAVTPPALHPKHHGDLLRRMDMYQAVRDGLQQRLEDGALDLPARSRHDLMDLHQAICEIESLLPYLLEGKSPPYSGELAAGHALGRYLVLELQARASVRELVVDQPRHLLPLLDDMNSLSYVADDLATVLAKNHRLFKASAPQVCGYMEQLHQALKADTQHSLREAQVQSDILGLLGSAAQGFSQERMDHHRHSAGGWLGRHGGARTARAASLVGMNVVKPQTYGAKIEGELTANFGAFFHIRTSGEKTVELSLKPEVPGSISTQALLKELQFMNEFLGRHRDRETVKAAIQASPDVQWVREGGVDRLALTQAALKRLSTGSTAEASLDAAPRDRLQARLAQVADGVKLSEFKAALVTTFRADIEALDQRADSLCNPVAALTGAKAELLDTLVDDLVACPDAAQMLARVDRAIKDHDALWRGSWQARDGGSTALLLADMRAAVRRYAQDPG